jgi:hypothetical protein
MGSSYSIRQVANDPRVLGIPSPVSTLHAADRRAAEKEDILARNRQVDNNELADPGHNRSCVNVLDSGKLSKLDRSFAESKGNSKLRRIGIAILAIWCIASTGIAIVTYTTVLELEKIINSIEVVTSPQEVKK